MHKRQENTFVQFVVKQIEPRKRFIRFRSFIHSILSKTQHKLETGQYNFCVKIGTINYKENKNVVKLRRNKIIHYICNPN